MELKPIGFVSLANNFVNYATILTIALNSMSGRFISIEIHKGKQEEASKYFSSIFWANILIIGVLIIPSIILILYLEKFLNIPTNIILDVKVLFSLIFLNFYISIISSTYQVATFATNKLHLQSLRNLEGNIIRVAVLLIAFMFFIPHVFYIGLASLITTIFVFLMNVYYKKKLLPNIENKLSLCSFKKIKEVTSAGIWNTVTKLGQVLSDGLDLMICNLLIDPMSMGQLAIVKTVSSVMGTLLSTVSGIFQPEFIISYAKEKKDELVQKLKISMKTSAIFANIPFCFLIVFGREFFSLWVPSQNCDLLYILTILTIQGVIFSGIINPMYSIYTVTNKIKVDGLCRVGLGFISTFIVFILLKATNLGIYAVAAVSTLLGSIFNIIFVPIYVAKACLNIKWNTFYPTIFRYIFTTVIMAITFSMFRLFVTINTWRIFLIMVLSLGTLGSIINYIILLNNKEKKNLLDMIKNIFLKLKGNKA